MKFLFDFFPVALFFVAYKLADIFVATMVAMAASVAQVAWTWFRHRRTENTQVITLVLVVVLGGATLWLKDPMFIKWKPTLVNGLFALAFLLSQFLGEKTIVERMMGHALTLPAAIWRKVNLSWVAFFTAMALANLYVVYSFDEATWVNFKLFGILGLTFAFVLLQGVFLGRFVKPETEVEQSKER